MNTQREQLIYTWLTSVLKNDQFKIAFLAGDASFRRYARIQLQNKTYMLMDAPPEKEDCVPFVTIDEFCRPWCTRTADRRERFGSRFSAIGRFW